MAPDGTAWQVEMTRTVGRRVKLFRQRTKPRLTVAQLAERCADLGNPVSRDVITSLEVGRRESVSLAEVVTLAAALRVPPVALAYPIGEADAAELLPGWTVGPEVVRYWFGGDPTLRLDHDAYGQLFDGPADDLLRLLDQYQAAIDTCLQATRLLPNAVGSAAVAWTETRNASRREITGLQRLFAAAGWVPPALPDELAREVNDR